MMHIGIRDLFASERGVLVILLVIASTVLVLVGKISGEAWLAYTRWIAIALVASKTVTGAVETWTGTNAPDVAEPASK